MGAICEEMNGCLSEKDLPHKLAPTRSKSPPSRPPQTFLLLNNFTRSNLHSSFEKTREITCPFTDCRFGDYLAIFSVIYRNNYYFVRHIKCSSINSSKSGKFSYQVCWAKLSLCLHCFYSNIHIYGKYFWVAECTGTTPIRFSSELWVIVNRLGIY